MNSKEVWGCFLMSGVRMLHFLKDWWKFIQIHQYCTLCSDDLNEFQSDLNNPAGKAICSTHMYSRFTAGFARPCPSCYKIIVQLDIHKFHFNHVTLIVRDFDFININTLQFSIWPNQFHMLMRTPCYSFNNDSYQVIYNHFLVEHVFTPCIASYRLYCQVNS